MSVKVAYGSSHTLHDHYKQQSTFQPVAKTLSRNSLSSNSLKSNSNEHEPEKSNSSRSGKASASTTHYIIQHDPLYDTKLIDGLLRQKSYGTY